MGFADVWNRTLVYFGIAEEDDWEDEDGYLSEGELERSYGERPNVRRLAPRRRGRDFDDWTDPEPGEGDRTTVLRPRPRAVPSVRRRPLHELHLLAAQGHHQTDRPPTPLREYLLDDGRVLHRDRQKHPARHVRGRFIELLDKAPEYALVRLIDGPVQLEVVSPDHIPPAHEPDLHVRFLFLAREPEYIHVRPVAHLHYLPLGGPLDRLHLVP